MTVSELIEALQRMPGEAEVYAQVAGYDWYKPVTAARLSGVVPTEMGVGSDNWREMESHEIARVAAMVDL